MYETASKPQAFTVDYFLITCQSHWRFMIVAFLALFIPMVIVSLSQPVLYTATAKVLFESARRINLEMSTSLTARDATRVMPVEKLNSQAEIITSSPLLVQLIQALELAETPEQEQQQLVNLRNKIKAQVVPTSSVIAISYTDKNPVLARRVVNTLAELFTDHYIGAVQGEDDPLAFYQHLYDGVADTLKKNTTQLKNIRNELGIHTSFSSEYNALAERSKTLTARLSEIDLSLAKDRAKAAVFERGLASEPARISSAVDMVPNPARLVIERELNLLISKKEEMLIRYTADNPAVKRKVREIASLQRRLEDFPEKVVGRSTLIGNPRHQGLKREITEVRANIDQLTRIRSKVADELEETQSRLNKLQERQYVVVALEDSIDQDLKHRRQYHDKLTDARFIDSMHRQDISSISVIEKAITPAAKSKHAEGIALSFILSAVVAFGLVVVRDVLRPVVKNAEELRALMQAPVLATLPDYSKGSPSALGGRAKNGHVQST